MLEGYAFRASIALPKEVTLLEEAWAAAKAGTWLWMWVGGVRAAVVVAIACLSYS